MRGKSDDLTTSMNWDYDIWIGWEDNLYIGVGWDKAWWWEGWNGYRTTAQNRSIKIGWNKHGWLKPGYLHIH